MRFFFKKLRGTRREGEERRRMSYFFSAGNQFHYSIVDGKLGIS
jgi:hypothetical protein